MLYFSLGVVDIIPLAHHNDLEVFVRKSKYVQDLLNVSCGGHESRWEKLSAKTIVNIFVGLNGTVLPIIYASMVLGLTVLSGLTKDSKLSMNDV